MPANAEKKWAWYLQVAVLILAALNAWWNARLEASLALTELRLERRMTELFLATRQPALKSPTKETSW